MGERKGLEREGGRAMRVGGWVKGAWKGGEELGEREEWGETERDSERQR